MQCLCRIDPCRNRRRIEPQRAADAEARQLIERGQLVNLPLRDAEDLRHFTDRQRRRASLEIIAEMQGRPRAGALPRRTAGRGRSYLRGIFLVKREHKAKPFCPFVCYTKSVTSTRFLTGGLWAVKAGQATIPCILCETCAVCKTCNRQQRRGFCVNRQVSSRGRSSVG